MKDEKYQKLTQYLLDRGEREIPLSFSQIQEILGFSLDASAYQYREFWANCTASTKAYSWMEAGYEITEIDLKGQTVLFKQKNWL